MLAALAKSFGVVSPALLIAKVGRTTFYEWCKTDPDFKKEVEECEGEALDMAETQLYKQIQNGNTIATIFYLKTKGKKRGYVERQEWAGVDDQPLTFRVNITPPEKSDG